MRVTLSGAARRVRVIFNPVFSNRCSPFRWLGPARYTGKDLAGLHIFVVSLDTSLEPLCKVEEMPAVDTFVLSPLVLLLAQSLRPVHPSHLSFQWNTHDFLTSTDVPALRALLANPSSSARIFVALNNGNRLSKALRIPQSRIHELDWWDEPLLRVLFSQNTPTALL